MKLSDHERPVKERHFEIIHRVTASVTQSLDLETVLATALSETMAALGVDSGGIYIVDDDSGELDLGVQHNLTEAFVAKLSHIKPGQGCGGTTLMTKKMFTASDVPESRFICRDAEQLMGLDCLVAAPMIIKTKVVGVLELFAPVSRRLTADEAELLESICNQVAVAIENAKLFTNEQQAHDEARQALEDQALLLESAETISASLELGDILERLTALTGKLTGLKRIAIMLLEPDTDELVVGAVIDPVHPEALPVGQRFTLGDFGAAQDLLNGQTVVVSDTPSVSMRMRELSERTGMKSAVMVPLNFREQVVGVMLLDTATAEPFDDRQVQLAEGIAKQAAAAIENSRVFDQQRTIAETLQKSLLPKAIPRVAGLEIAAAYRPTTGHALVGGDFYDFISLANGDIGMVVGDVAGKGVNAATSTGIVKYAVHALALENPAPAAVLARANLAACQQFELWQFVTLVYMNINGQTGAVTYGNAGHPPPILFRAATNRFEELSFGDLPLGIFTEYQYRPHSLVLQPDDLLVFYTDGIIEARTQTELFGEERLRRLVHDYSRLSCRALCRTIVDDARRFAGGRVGDDVVVVAVKKK